MNDLNVTQFCQERKCTRENRKLREEERRLQNWEREKKEFERVTLIRGRDWGERLSVGRDSVQGDREEENRC